MINLGRTRRHAGKPGAVERAKKALLGRGQTTVKVGDERWSVPRGFGREYQRIAKLDVELPLTDAAEGLIELLGLVGYTSTVAEVSKWTLRDRVEANVYAANVHMRASDNPIQRHPKPSWFPDAWQGPPMGDGLYAGPGPTSLKRSADG